MSETTKTLRGQLEYAVELLCSDQTLPPCDADRAAIAANIQKALSTRWATGVLSHVDFETVDDDRPFTEEEMMIHIITPQGGVSAGTVHWCMLRESDVEPIISEKRPSVIRVKGVDYLDLTKKVEGDSNEQ